MSGKVRISHCIVEGVSQSVSVFADIPPKQRPIVFCPECEGRLILKLGKIGKPAHHAAHKAENSTCSLSTPEGALHFNTKMYISEQLAQGSKLQIKQPCKRTHCWNRSFLAHVLAADWDFVQCEAKLQSTRPDIVLYREGVPIAAIEIYVTHKVDEEKKQKLLNIDVPWIEVKAVGEVVDEYFVNLSHEDEESAFPWRINKPMIFHQTSLVLQDWVCDDCEKESAAMAKRQVEYKRQQRIARIEEVTKRRAEIERKKLYLDRPNNKICFAIALEFVVWGEQRRFDLFVVKRTSTEPPHEIEELYMKNGKYGSEIIYSEMPVTEDSEQRMKEFFRDWLVVNTHNAVKMNRITGGWVSESDYDRIVDQYDNPYKNILNNIDRSLLD